MIVATFATAPAIGIAGVLTYADYSFPVATLLAWFAVVALVGGLAYGRGIVFPIALAGLGLLALVEFLHGTLLSPAAPLIGGGLLASAELGYWSFELRWKVAQSKSTSLRRSGAILGLVLIGAAFSGIAAALMSTAGAPL